MRSTNNQIVDFGEGGPVRCSRCKGYINPFMKFVDQGRRFMCNFCDETPRDYQCNLGPNGRRRDADEPMPAVFFFLIDVSMNALQTGATAGACSAISRVIADLPEIRFEWTCCDTCRNLQFNMGSLPCMVSLSYICISLADWVIVSGLLLVAGLI